MNLLYISEEESLQLCSPLIPTLSNLLDLTNLKVKLDLEAIDKKLNDKKLKELEKQLIDANFTALSAINEASMLAESATAVELMMTESEFTLIDSQIFSELVIVIRTIQNYGGEISIRYLTEVANNHRVIHSSIQKASALSSACQEIIQELDIKCSTVLEQSHVQEQSNVFNLFNYDTRVTCDKYDTRVTCDKYDTRVTCDKYDTRVTCDKYATHIAHESHKSHESHDTRDKILNDLSRKKQDIKTLSHDEDTSSSDHETMICQLVEKIKSDVIIQTIIKESEEAFLSSLHDKKNKASLLRNERNESIIRLEIWNIVNREIDKIRQLFNKNKDLVDITDFIENRIRAAIKIDMIIKPNTIQLHIIDAKLIKKLCLCNIGLTTMPKLDEVLDIIELDISGNKLQEVPSMQKFTNLQIFNCSRNRIRVIIDVEKCRTLTSIICDFNELESIQDLSLLPLEVLDISHNRLKKLPKLPLYIKYLIAKYNSIEGYLDLSYIPCIKVINLSHNKLSFIRNISNDVERVFIDNNMINNIENLPINVIVFSCSFNNIAMLPGVSYCTRLEKLILNNNRILELRERLPITLCLLECSSNPISWLPSLPNSLKILSCAHTRIERLLNIPPYIVRIRCSKTLEQFLKSKIPSEYIMLE